MPARGVPMLPPSPSIVIALARGRTSSSDSRPRTQCGTIAGSPRTLASPSFFISASVQSIASSSAFVPLKREPKVSVR